MCGDEVVEYPSASWNQQKLNDALKSPDHLMKIGAIRAIQEAPKDEHVRGLIDSLDEPDRLVRVNAALALGKVKSPLAAIPLIRHAVTDTDKEVQSYALWAYRQIEYAKASPQLVELLITSDSPPMIRFAANEIRQKGDVKAIEAIIQRFHSRELYAGYDLDLKAVNALYEIGNSVVEPLVKCLDDVDVRAQVNAIYALGKIGDDRAVNPLIAHLAPAGIEIRSRISDALIKIGRQSIPDLIMLLDHADRDIKWIAAYILGGIGKEAEPALLKALHARNGKSSEDIIYALGIAGGEGSFTPLYEIYNSTKDDSVKAWSTISLANLVSRHYDDIKDAGAVNQFMGTLREQLKPHMMLSYDALLRLGKIYVNRSLETTDKFSDNVAVAVKCYDLSLIEQENMLAKASRLFFGSYLKLMSSRSPEIMSYIERDFVDLKKDAEKAEYKKEIMLHLNQILQVLRSAYGDKNFNFQGQFKEYTELCISIERFMPAAVIEESKKLSQKEIAKLHTDVEIVQRKINMLIQKLGTTGDTESTAQAMRLSTEIAKLETGTSSDYRAIESCLRNIVSRMSLSGDQKSDLYFKILMISKNGLTQADLVTDQILKSLNVEGSEEKKAEVSTAKAEPVDMAKSHTVEYVVIAVLVILIILVLVIALNKFGVITLPFQFPISWLNKDVAVALANLNFF